MDEIIEKLKSELFNDIILNDIVTRILSDFFPGIEYSWYRKADQEIESGFF